MKKQHGFTLLELLISLSITMVITSLLTPLLNTFYDKSNLELNKLEWEVFVQQVKLEVRASNELTVKGNTLYLKGPTSTQVVSYEPYQGSIRRRVNSTGHEVILQNIASVEYIPESKGVTVLIKDRNGLNYSARITGIHVASVREL